MITINLATIKLCRSSWNLSWRNAAESLIKLDLFEWQLIIWESWARKQFLISILQRRILIAATRASSQAFLRKPETLTNIINFDIFLITDIFDVYNIETALPVIDLEAIETHLMAAKEEEQKVSC